MVEIIRLIILEYIPDGDADYDFNVGKIGYGKSERCVAEIILKRQEEAGILPPCNDLYCNCTHADGSANKWEPEDG